jgi:ArsR family metal-binding transcriptional regulator
MEYMSNEQIQTAITAVSEIGKVIRKVKRIPSGHLYAQLMGVLSLEKYEMIISLLKKTGLVTEQNNELIWMAD